MRTRHSAFTIRPAIVNRPVPWVRMPVIGGAGQHGYLAGPHRRWNAKTEPGLSPCAARMQTAPHGYGKEAEPAHAYQAASGHAYQAASGHGTVGVGLIGIGALACPPQSRETRP